MYFPKNIFRENSIEHTFTSVKTTVLYPFIVLRGKSRGFAAKIKRHVKNVL
jgi:hypothetical protein